MEAMTKSSTAEDREYLVKRLDAANLEDLDTLHLAVYGKMPSAGHYREKYNTAYTGAEYIGYIAYTRDNIPVAYYGVLPCFIQCGPDILLSAQSGDTMTHPGYRYKGMFVELSKITFELCRKSGIKLIFGFPNQNSFHGAVNKLGWQMTESMERFTIPVNGLPLESLSHRFEWAKGIYRKYVRWVAGNYLLQDQGLPNAMITEGFAGLYRNEDYYKYKTYSHAAVIKAGQAKAWIKIKNGLTIGDLVPEKAGFTEAMFEESMTAIRKIARLMGLSKISFHVSPGTRLHALFSAKYKPLPSFPVLFQDFGSGVSLHSLKFSFSDLDIF